MIDDAATDATPLVLEAHNLCKRYVGGDGAPIAVLDDVELSVRQGETIAVVGQSGSGKSTLLQILGGLDRPSSGRVLVGGQSLDRLGDEALARVRGRTIGFVFQFHHLLREFSAVENVMIPQLIARRSPRAARERARELLVQVGLEHRLTHKPTQLSGGEQQRVAVARALANEPLAVLADEPTGNLDPSTSERLHDLLFQVNRENRAALVLVTHNRELARRADRTLRLENGRLVVVSPASAEVASTLFE